MVPHNLTGKQPWSEYEMPAEQVFALLDEWTAQGQPYFFALDYAGTKGIACRWSDSLAERLWFTIEDRVRVGPSFSPFGKSFQWQPQPVDLPAFAKAFNTVKSGIQYGNSYLCNLTFPTPVSTDLDLATIYRSSEARFKLLLPGKLVCFSPEIFVRIENNRISSYPMKGTIDANIPNAEQCILSNPKERAEHFTIVDLIRNDLSQVARQVQVDRFRYVERIQRHNGDLLQVSSEISGQLRPQYQHRYGSILRKLLPAGSISGAPKKETLALIAAAENYDRDYYTGIFGCFDGQRFDSAVLIRFIEQTEHGLIFKSGGGITSQSVLEQEYQELIEKVYVPVV